MEFLAKCAAGAAASRPTWEPYQDPPLSSIRRDFSGANKWGHVTVESALNAYPALALVFQPCLSVGPHCRGTQQNLKEPSMWCIVSECALIYTLLESTMPSSAVKAYDCAVWQSSHVESLQAASRAANEECKQRMSHLGVVGCLGIPQLGILHGEQVEFNTCCGRQLPSALCLGSQERLRPNTALLLFVYLPCCRNTLDH